MPLAGALGGRPDGRGLREGVGGSGGRGLSIPSGEKQTPLCEQHTLHHKVLGKDLGKRQVEGQGALEESKRGMSDADKQDAIPYRRSLCYRTLGNLITLTRHRFLLPVASSPTSTQFEEMAAVLELRGIHQAPEYVPAAMELLNSKWRRSEALR